ncbi:endospore coat-associated protein [Bacillus sp. UMB0899]|nr:endospore coat-associated protein [Bacillus sp. UMB0899]
MKGVLCLERITLGMMSVSISHEHGYMTEIAKRSATYGINCVRFVPSSIDPTDLTITGEIFNTQTQTWISDTFSIPPFIYDRCFYNQNQASKRCKPIVEWLKKNPDIIFLGYGLPDKWKVYSEIQKNNHLNSYLPDTELISTPMQIVKHLKNDSSCLLKPVTGSRGIGIVAIFQTQKEMTISYHSGPDRKSKTFQSMKLFNNWCERLLKQQTYLLQPLLPLIDSEGYPFDIRILLQKDAGGKWSQVEKGVRKGYQGSFLSNLTTGGEPVTYEQWSQQLTPRQRFLLEDELSTITSHLPPLLEERFGRLFELGIDIGYAKDGSIWILDVNSKPGRKTFIETKPQLKQSLYSAPLAYCKYLSTKNNQKGATIID